MRLDCGCRKALSFHNVFIKPKRSALPSRDFKLDRLMQFKHSHVQWRGIPIIAANMYHTGTLEMAHALSKKDCMTALHKFHKIEDVVAYSEKNSMKHVWLSIGMNDKDLPKLHEMVEGIREHNSVTWQPKICIDVANGYTEKFVEYVEHVREQFPLAIIMAGNVASFEMTEQLILSGADIVKVGIGPGSACTTRKKTGVGVPQLSAIDECADAAHGLGGMICADGGCVDEGDVSKALAAGADFVMLGGMLAGHDECAGDYVYADGSELPMKEDDINIHPGDLYKEDGEYKKTEPYQQDFKEWLKSLEDPVGMRFYGMSSTEAQEKHYGGKKTYRASEGKSTIVPYRGEVHNTMIEILGGIRSTMTYIGAARLKDIPKCATFVLTNEQLNQSFS